VKWVGWWGKVFLAEFGGGDGRKVGGGSEFMGMLLSYQMVGVVCLDFCLLLSSI